MTQIHALYTDAGLIGTNGSVEIGTFTWVHVDAQVKYLAHESGLVRPFADKAVENNMAELCALLRGLRSLPDGWSGDVLCDNVNALGWAGLIQKRDGNPWKSDGVPACLRPYIARQQERLGDLRGVHLDGHPTDAQLLAGRGKRDNPVSKWNRFCDDHCKAERVRRGLETGTDAAFRLTQSEWVRLTPGTQAALAALGYPVPGRPKERRERPVKPGSPHQLHYQEAV